MGVNEIQGVSYLKESVDCKFIYNKLLLTHPNSVLITIRFSVFVYEH
jgi:hypothetical protein